MNRITNHRKTFLDILVELKEKQITSIVPTFRPLVGYLYNDIAIENLELQINILEELFRLGMSYREIKVSILECETCHFNEFIPLLSCPLCSSTQIIKHTGLKHDICGNTNFKDKYTRFNGDLICPECNLKLNAVGVDYSLIETLYKCIRCKSFLSEGTWIYKCHRCMSTSSKNGIQLLELFGYIVDLDKVAEFIQSHDLLLYVDHALKDANIKSTLKHSIKGISKLDHSFSIVVSNNNSHNIVIDIINFENDPDMIKFDLLSFVTKCSDIEASQKILISIPSLDEEFRTLCFNNGITVLLAKDKEEVVFELIKMINNVFMVNLNES
jgi:Thaumarchaeal output domain 1